MENIIKIVSRSSALATIQARMVGNSLVSKNPNINVKYYTHSSIGDNDQSLDIKSANTVGVFTNTLSKLIIKSKYDIAVHSWKDYPVDSNKDASIFGTLARADMRDILLLKKPTIGSKKSISIMTSSPRRRYALKKILHKLIPLKYKKIIFKNLRGNIDTRIKKFMVSNNDGIVIAKAAIDRILSSNNNISLELKKQLTICNEECHWIILPLSCFPTAPGQGAIGIEAKSDNYNIIKKIKSINDEKTYRNVLEERKKMKQYGGGCSQKIGISIWEKNSFLIYSILGLTTSREKLKTIKVQNNLKDISYPINRNYIFPKNKKEQNIFKRTNINKNEMLSGIENSIIYISRKNVLHFNPTFKKTNILWTSGLKSWISTAKKGYWINGSSDSLGEDETLNISNFLGNNFETVKLSFSNKKSISKTVINTYKLDSPKFPKDLNKRTHFFWMSSFAFETAIKKFPEIIDRYHACGMGNTYDILSKVLGEDKRLSCYLSYDDWRKKMIKVENDN